LIRWIPDPGIELPEEDPELVDEADDAETQAGGSSSSDSQEGEESGGGLELPSGLGDLPVDNLPTDRLPDLRGGRGGRAGGR
jgi:hypothetical protein